MYLGTYLAGQQSGLGLLPSTSISMILGDLNTALSVFGLNSSDPTRDKQRLARIAQALALATANNTTPQSNLDNLSGEAYLHEIATDAPVAGGGTAGGSKVAVAAAKAALVELAARRGATGAVGALLPISTIPATIGYGVTSVAKSPVFLGLLGVGAYLLLRPKRGRR